MTYNSTTGYVSRLYGILQEKMYKDLDENSVQLLLNYLNVYKTEKNINTHDTKDKMLTCVTVKAVTRCCIPYAVNKSMNDILRVVNAYEETYALVLYPKLVNLLSEIREHCTISLKELEVK